MIRKEWDLNSLRDRIQLEAIRKGRPLSCTLELTFRCNFHCRMCYVRMTDSQAASYGRMRTVEEWLDMAAQLREAGVLYLTLTGGECTLYPGFERLYAQLAQMGFYITVMSNAAAYTDPLRDLFRRYPPATVGVTLYGGCGRTYEEVTGDPAGLDKAVENIRFFQSIQVPVRLNFTMIRQNAMDYPLVSRLSADLGLPYTLITDITPHQHDSAFSQAAECRLSPAERACVACHPPQEVQLAMETAKTLEKELTGFRMPVPAAGRPAGALDECIGSLTGCAIFWNGEMQTCISMNGYRNVRPFETGFEAAWAQLKAEHEATFRRPAACRACPMRTDCLHNCAARRFEGTGSPHEPDPYTCQYTYLLGLYKARRNGTEIPKAPPCD